MRTGYGVPPRVSRIYARHRDGDDRRSVSYIESECRSHGGRRTSCTQGPSANVVPSWNTFASERKRKRRFVSRGLGSGVDHGSFQPAPLNRAAKKRERRAGSTYAVGQNARTRRLRSMTVGT